MGGCEVETAHYIRDNNVPAILELRKTPRPAVSFNRRNERTESRTYTILIERRAYVTLGSSSLLQPISNGSIIVDTLPMGD